MKSYTDLEQSKKLADFLPPESADMMYHSVENEWGSGAFVATSKVITNGFENDDFYLDDIPCWSLAALMNLLPSKFTEKGKYSETTYEIHIRKYALTNDVDLYQIAYGNYKWYEDGSHSWKDMINTGEKENLIDAAFDMICWLKENNKL